MKTGGVAFPRARSKFCGAPSGGAFHLVAAASMSNATYDAATAGEHLHARGGRANASQEGLEVVDAVPRRPHPQPSSTHRSGSSAGKRPAPSSPGSNAGGGPRSGLHSGDRRCPNTRAQKPSHLGSKMKVSPSGMSPGELGEHRLDGGLLGGASSLAHHECRPSPRKPLKRKKELPGSSPPSDMLGARGRNSAPAAGTARLRPEQRACGRNSAPAVSSIGQHGAHARHRPIERSGRASSRARHGGRSRCRSAKPELAREWASESMTTGRRAPSPSAPFSWTSSRRGSVELDGRLRERRDDDLHVDVARLALPELRPNGCPRPMAPDSIARTTRSVISSLGIPASSGRCRRPSPAPKVAEVDRPVGEDVGLESGKRRIPGAAPRRGSCSVAREGAHASFRARTSASPSGR